VLRDGRRYVDTDRKQARGSGPDCSVRRESHSNVNVGNSDGSGKGGKMER
jgi:hypothetical protein